MARRSRLVWMWLCAAGCAGDPAATEHGGAARAPAAWVDGGTREDPAEVTSEATSSSPEETAPTSVAACEGGESCDDQSPCTIDFCEPLVGCVNLPFEAPCCEDGVSACDDADACTTDRCLPDGGCENAPSLAGCDDGNPCTIEDFCTASGCQPGPPPNCDDGDPCTDDACAVSAGGCHHAPASGAACDDGLACSIGDACVAGQCQGDTSGCACTPSFGPDAYKLTAVGLGTAGQPGEGLDLDGDATTCAPSSDCSGGIDNALGVLQSLVNPGVNESLGKGTLLLLVELRDLQQGPFQMAIYRGALAPSASGCAFQTASCEYLVKQEVLHPATCAPLVQLEATLGGTSIYAEAPEIIYDFKLPFVAGGHLTLRVREPRFKGGLVTGPGQGTTLQGIVAGAVRRDDLLSALDDIPESILPVPKDTLADLVDALVEADQDLDGDGVMEASSIGVVISGLPASLVGVAP